MKKIFLFVAVLCWGMSVAAATQTSMETENFSPFSPEPAFPTLVNPPFFSEGKDFLASPFAGEGDFPIESPLLRNDRPGGPGGTGGDVPVGNGIWILVFAGGAYALCLSRKRIKEMRS